MSGYLAFRGGLVLRTTLLARSILFNDDSDHGAVLGPLNEQRNIGLRQRNAQLNRRS